MTRLGRVAEVCVIVVTPFVVIASIPFFGSVGKVFPDILHTPLLGLIEFFSIYPAVVLLLIFSAAIFGQAGVSMYYSMNRKKLTGEILQGRELQSEDPVDISGRFSGKLMNGYLLITIATPATRETMRLFFDGGSGLGTLHGAHSEEHYLARWSVPVTDTEMECSVSVELHDVYTFKLFRISKFDERKALWNASAKILPVRPQKPEVQVDELSLPNPAILRPFDTSNLPLAGWVCVSIQNNTEKSYFDCCGVIKTDAGFFPIYDYGEVASSLNSDDGKIPKLFSLRAESGTLVCANIIARTPKAKVRIDFGGEVVEKELQINSQ